MPSIPFPTKTHYPDSDGQPMAENTLQYEWIVKLKTNLEHIFRQEPEVFIAADLLWYPLEGKYDINRAPDVMVAFGRPKGHRGSYLQWLEGDIAPQVVIEVVSPSNRFVEMSKKQLFYQRYGVEEYCVIEPFPDAPGIAAWQRVNDVLASVEIDTHWESPRLGIKVGIEEGKLVVRDPEGNPFQTAEAIKAQNEELDIANKQLATANEELDTVNKELTTANADLLAKNEELAKELARLREELARGKDGPSS